MSEPVKNAEVEDVLSSIRRLVSEDKRPLQTPQAEPAAETFTDRLVLTPALRVAEPKDAEGQETAKQTQSTDADGGDDLETLLSQTITDDAADTTDTAAPETSNASEEVEETAQDAAQDPADDYADDPYNFADDHDNDGEAEGALLLKSPVEAAPEDAHDEGAHDENTRDDTAHDEDTHENAEHDQVARDASDHDEDTHDENTHDEDTHDEAAQDEHTGDAAQGLATVQIDSTEDTLSAKIAALETAIGDISDEWEPDDAGQDAYAGSEPETMVWEDDIPKAFPSAADNSTSNPSDQHHDAPPISEMMEPIDGKTGEWTEDRHDLDALYAVNDAPAAVSDGHEEGILREAEADAYVYEDASYSEGADEGSLAGAQAQDDLADDTPDHPADGQNDAEQSGNAGSAEDATAFALGADDQILDEDALRDMISEIVHQELQGALGARITRNVRRLVRREIHRALTARDLD